MEHHSFYMEYNVSSLTEIPTCTLLPILEAFLRNIFMKAEKIKENGSVS